MPSGPGHFFCLFHKRGFDSLSAVTSRLCLPTTELQWQRFGNDGFLPCCHDVKLAGAVDYMASLRQTLGPVCGGSFTQETSQTISSPLCFFTREDKLGLEGL